MLYQMPEQSHAVTGLSCQMEEYAVFGLML